MKRHLLMLLAAFVLFSSGVSAQTKTVTNADLEKFKQKRLAAERELRENYEKLGFPSPEELAKRNAEEAEEREALSAQLRRERIAREQAEAARLAAEAARQQSTPDIIIVEGDRIQPSFGYPFYTYRDRRRGRFPYFRNRFPQVYRATPGGVIYEPGRRSSFIYSPRTNRPPQRIRPPRPR